MEMLKSEQESIDMKKVMMQTLEGCSLGGDYMNGLGLSTVGAGGGGGTVSPSPPAPSLLPQSMNDLLGGFINPSTIMANNMDPSMMSTLLEQMANIQSQLLSSQSLPFLPQQHTIIPNPPATTTPNKEEAYCDLCDKSFRSQFFLESHRAKMHGIGMEDGGSPVKGIHESTSPIEGMEGGRNSSVIRERSSVEGTSTDRIMKKEENGSIESEGMTPSSATVTSKCDECSFETENFLTLIHHKTLHHTKIEREIVNTVTPPSSFPCGDCDQSFESSGLLSQHSALVHGQFGNLLNMFSGAETNGFPAFLLNTQLPNPFSSLGNTPPVVKPPPPKRNYSSAGKNYCDVCNKEVCNKYFLRTHMLKMHGIVIDENKPVIANIDTRERERTGELTFRCDICSTTLTSRQQLRDHKQSAHGVSYPVGTPTQAPTMPHTPTRPNKPASLLPSSMLISSMTTPSISSLDLSALLPESASLAAAATAAAAAAIPSEMNAASAAAALSPTTVLPTETMQLQQPAASSTSVVSAASENSQQLQQKEQMMQQTQGMAKCQHCVYTTKFSRNMEYHVERHERLNEMERGGVMRIERMDREEGRGEKGGKRKGGREEEEVMDVTTNVAIRMAKGNQISSFECTKCHRSFSSPSVLHSHTEMFHSGVMQKAASELMAKKKKLGLMKTSLPKGAKIVKKGGMKRKLSEKEKENDLHGERHSVTSGSISPLRSDLPEGMAACDSGYSLQSLLISTPLGLPLPSQFTASLPLSSPLLSPLTLTLTLTPIHS